MGKYTSLARNLQGGPVEPQEEGVRECVVRNTNVKINSNEYIGDTHTTKTVPAVITTVRPTTLKSLMGDGKNEKRNAVVCMHGATEEECGLCSGYVRWLIAGGSVRIDRARRDPEAARRAFWREVKGRSA